MLIVFVICLWQCGRKRGFQENSWGSGSTRWPNRRANWSNEASLNPPPPKKSPRRWNSSQISGQRSDSMIWYTIGNWFRQWLNLRAENHQRHFVTTADSTVPWSCLSFTKSRDGQENQCNLESQVEQDQCLYYVELGRCFAACAYELLHANA